MRISPTTTLAEIVDSDPALARELERYGLDYCCGGGRTLAEACAASVLDVDDVVTALSMLHEPTSSPWSSHDVVELVDRIEAVHHVFLWEELPLLDALVTKVVGVHGERHPELAEVARLFGAVNDDLRPHLLKEERILFPAIRQLARRQGEFPRGAVHGPVSVMLAEHDQLGELLAELRSVTDGYQLPADACASYRECYRRLVELETDTHLHIHRENNVLFPLVEALESGGPPADPALSSGAQPPVDSVGPQGR